MGHAAPTPIFPSTRLDVARSDYVLGVIDVEAFERRVGELIFAGQDADPGIIDLAPPGPPAPNDRSPFPHPSMETVLR